MPTSQYLPFAIGGGVGSPNTLTPAALAALTTLLTNGFQPGIAKSEEINTLLRQVTVGVAALASFAATYGANNANDDGSVTNFRAALKSALDTLYIQDLSPLVADADFTGANQSLGSNGWQKLPGGLILQWGVYTTDMTVATPVILNFPTPFTVACYNLQLTPRNPSNDQVADSWIELMDRTTLNFTCVAQNTGNSGTNFLLHGFDWFAIGR